MLQPFIMVEQSPAAAGTAASSLAVQNVGGTFPKGIAFPLDDSDAVFVVAEFGGNTNGTLNVYVQVNPDGAGLNWYDIIAFPQAGAGGAVTIYAAPISNSTITTTTPLVGKNLSPALSASIPGNVVNGAFSDRMRIVMVSGVGTTAGTTVTVTFSAQRRWNRLSG